MRTGQLLSCPFIAWLKGILKGKIKLFVGRILYIVGMVSIFLYNGADYDVVH